MVQIPWTRIVEIAALIERDNAERGVVDTGLGLRLARALMEFQEQLVAVGVRRARTHSGTGP